VLIHTGYFKATTISKFYRRICS